MELIFISLCVFVFVLMFVILLQIKENGKLAQKVKSLGSNQDDAFREIDDLALKVQAMHTDLYAWALKKPAVKKAPAKPRRGRPPGSANKTKGANK